MIERGDVKVNRIFFHIKSVPVTGSTRICKVKIFAPSQNWTTFALKNFVIN